MKEYDFDPRKIPPEYLQAIGLVVAASSQTESVLNMFIGGLLGIDGFQSLSFGKHLSNSVKDQILRTLIELDAPSTSEIDKVDELLDRAKEALERRNEVVHNTLVIEPGTGAIMSHRIKTKGSIELILRPVSVDEIERVAVDVYRAGEDIIGFMMSRSLFPIERAKPLREAVERSKAARAKRKQT